MVATRIQTKAPDARISSKMTAVLAMLVLDAALTGCGAGVLQPSPALRASASPANRPGAIAPSPTRRPAEFPSHENLQSLADRIADALAADDPPAAVKALEEERSAGSQCSFRATFNGHAGFSSVQKAEAEARKVAHAAGATDFAVATRIFPRGVLGVLVMAWCPKQSFAPTSGQR